MERHLRVAMVWNWLPAFRVIAETEHLPTAAQILHVTPPALSRTIRLLEDALGVPLFARAGRRLRINDEGQALLVHVRHALRIVDDGIQRVSGGSAVVRIAVDGVVAELHMPRLLVELRRSYPHLHLEVSTFRGADVVPSLLQGRLDLGISSRTLSAPGLLVRRLGAEPNGIYCGPGHPLWGASDPDLSDVLGHPFTAPAPDEDGLPTEGWPAELERDVAMVLDRLTLGLEACAQAGMLAVLPDALVAGSSSPLYRVPVELVSPTPIMAVMRRPLGERGYLDDVLEIVESLIVAGASGAAAPASRAADREGEPNKRAS